MPFLGLIGAFLVAVFAGSRICPTLSALVFPPEPPLPQDGAVTVKPIKPVESKGVGLDEWLYGTSMSACDLAAFYQSKIGSCTYDPDSGCQSAPKGGSLAPGVPFPVATCQGRQEIGGYAIRWIVYISGGFGGEFPTQFRVIREAVN